MMSIHYWSKRKPKLTFILNFFKLNQISCNLTFYMVFSDNPQFQQNLKQWVSDISHWSRLEQGWDSPLDVFWIWQERYGCICLDTESTRTNLTGHNNHHKASSTLLKFYNITKSFCLLSLAGMDPAWSGRGGGGGSASSGVGHVCRPPINLLHYCKVLLDYCIWIVIVVHLSSGYYSNYCISFCL
jgi:hypothetical protein